MKLTEWINLHELSDDTPVSVRQELGSILSRKHFELTGQKPQKTPELVGKKGRSILTCEYPEWFLQKMWDSALDEIIERMKSKLSK